MYEIDRLIIKLQHSSVDFLLKLEEKRKKTFDTHQQMILK